MCVWVCVSVPGCAWVCECVNVYMFMYENVSGCGWGGRGHAVCDCWNVCVICV